MLISRLRLLNFRVYREAELILTPGVTMVVGRNGQGKTTLLEAIATLALTRSPRAAALGDCATWGSSRMGVSAHFEDGRGQADLELRADQEPGSGRWTRRLRQDGQPAAPRGVLGRLRVVVFWPDDLLLIKGGPEPRRRLLDVVLSQLSSGYVQALGRYRRALEHRTAVLRRLREGLEAPDSLRPWSQALVEQGAVVVAERSRFLAALEPQAQSALATIGEPAEVRLRYLPALGGEVGLGDDEPAARLSQGLAARAHEELARAQCLVGPHRDDFEVVLGGQPARQFASQGQQRSLVLALKVAEVAQHRAVDGETPLLLLDDVLSELDRGRRQGLISLLGGELAVEQTVITATEDPGIGAELPIAQVLEACAGVVAPKSTDTP
ncbi:MAG: DNA replication/repair protein RecF [Candidatus Dormibacteria bacterium]